MEGMSEREYSAHSGLSRGAIQKARKQGRQDEDQSRSTEIHEIKCHMLAAAAPLIAMLWRNAGATGGDPREPSRTLLCGPTQVPRLPEALSGRLSRAFPAAGRAGWGFLS